jgi:hypothetical protein
MPRGGVNRLTSKLETQFAAVITWSVLPAQHRYYRRLGTTGVGAVLPTTIEKLHKIQEIKLKLAILLESRVEFRS